MKKQNKEGVFYALKTAARSHRLLTAGTLLCVAGSVAASLLPPLLLARMIDSLTGGVALTFTAVLLYFGSLVLEGVFSSAQETLLVIFGQKMTHALRAEMSQKLGGVDVADITDRERRSCIGCVEQHFSRVPGTVLEQITLSDPGVTEEMRKMQQSLPGWMK